MKEFIKQKLREELTKADVKEIVKSEFNSNALKTKVVDIINKEIRGNKHLEDKVVDITSNVLTQLYKQLWVKRSFWKQGLNNNAS